MPTQRGQRRRGRPRSEVEPIIYHIKLILYSGEDDDLIALYRAAPPMKRTALTKMTLRAGGLQRAQAGLDQDHEADAEAAADFLV
jgi:hypothetical protein